MAHPVVLKTRAGIDISPDLSGCCQISKTKPYSRSRAFQRRNGAIISAVKARAWKT
jgi:hypothetical protein